MKTSQTLPQYMGPGMTPRGPGGGGGGVGDVPTTITEIAEAQEGQGEKPKRKRPRKPKVRQSADLLKKAFMQCFVKFMNLLKNQNYI